MKMVFNNFNNIEKKTDVRLNRNNINEWYKADI